MLQRVGILALLVGVLAGCGAAPTSLLIEATEATPTEITPPACANAGEVRTRHADGMEMECVPADMFLMGSTDEDIDAVMAECDTCDRE